MYGRVVSPILQILVSKAAGHRFGSFYIRNRDGAEEAPDDRCEGVRRENSILGEGVKVAIGNILKPATAYIGDWRSVGGASCLLYFGQPISQPFRAMISLFFFPTQNILTQTRKIRIACWIKQESSAWWLYEEHKLAWFRPRMVLNPLRIRSLRKNN